MDKLRMRVSGSLPTCTPMVTYGPTYPPESLIKVWLAHGPPKDCARLIQEWIDMGITTPVLRFTSKDQLGQVRRFIDEVLPLLRLK